MIDDAAPQEQEQDELVVPAPVIKHGKPTPPPKTGSGRRASKWGFLRDMEVGESAHFGDLYDQEKRNAVRARLASAASRYGRLLDRDFTVRTLADKGEVAVWRER